MVVKNIRANIVALLTTAINSADFVLKDECLKALCQCYKDQTKLEEIETNLKTIIARRSNVINTLILTTENMDANPVLMQQNSQIVAEKEKAIAEVKRKAEDMKVTEKVRMEKLKIDEEKRKQLKEAENQAKIESGLKFGNWEIGEVKEHHNEYPSVVDYHYLEIHHKQTDLTLIYYIEGDKLGFEFPYIADVKNYMKDEIGMKWNRSAWVSTTYVKAIYKLIKYFEDIENWEDSKKFGKGKNAYEKTNTLKNVFDQCPEVLEHLATIYPNVQKHLNDYAKTILPKPEPEQSEPETIQ